MTEPKRGSRGRISAYVSGRTARLRGGERRFELSFDYPAEDRFRTVCDAACAWKVVSGVVLVLESTTTLHPLLGSRLIPAGRVTRHLNNAFH